MGNKVYCVDIVEEKINGLNTIMKQTTSKDGWNYDEEMLEAVAVYCLKVDKLSCKEK